MGFQLVPKSVTLNDLERPVALILRYFTEFVYDIVVKHLLGLARFQNLLLIDYGHINTICASISDYLDKTSGFKYPTLQTVVPYASVS